MPIDPVIAERLHLLEGITSFAEPAAVPEKQARVDAFMVISADYRPPRCSVRCDVVAGPHGAVPVRIYTPPATRGTGARPGLVWAHGGGFQGGDLDMPESDLVARELCGRADAVIVCVDYHLAVDAVRFPVPHDDMMAAFRWVARHAAELGVDPARIALGGASAGANLATGAALHLRDDVDAVTPNVLLLAYPTMHAELPPMPPEFEAKLSAVPRVFRFRPEDVRAMSSNYLGHDPDRGEISPYAMPAAGKVAGLPPVLIITSEYDDLLLSGTAFAAQLEQAGVAVDQRTIAGVLHGHLNHDPGLPGTEQSLQLFADALRTPPA